MKKFGKFLAVTAVLAAAAGGVYYFMKNVLNNDQKEDLEDFEEDFDDFDLDDADEKTEDDSASREYVTINPEAPKDEETADAEPTSKVDPTEA